MFWVPQSGNVGVGVSIPSLRGRRAVGPITDRKLCPDPGTSSAASSRSSTTITSDVVRERVTSAPTRAFDATLNAGGADANAVAQPRCHASRRKQQNRVRARNEHLTKRENGLPQLLLKRPSGKETGCRFAKIVEFSFSAVRPLATVVSAKSHISMRHAMDGSPAYFVRLIQQIKIAGPIALPNSAHRSRRLHPAAIIHGRPAFPATTPLPDRAARGVALRSSRRKNFITQSTLSASLRDTEPHAGRHTGRARPPSRRLHRGGRCRRGAGARSGGAGQRSGGAMRVGA